MESLELSAADLQKQCEEFLSRLFSRISDSGLKMEPHWDIDHLCFRSDSIESYESFKLTFSKIGTLLIESDVNGRPIATFELNYPIRFQHWLIRLIELPAPKKGKVCRAGFEHIEIVVDTPLQRIANQHPALMWDSSGLKKLFNPELELSFGDSAVKFHNLSLKSVINFEQRPKFAMMVTQLRLFEIFKDHEPFIAGTLPLAIDIPGSDIDFVVTFLDHSSFSRICTEEFSDLPNFSLSQGHMNEADYSLCEFLYQDVPVEIYSSTVSTFQQNAYLHFQIEEKLLKYGKIEWQKEIVNLKAGGLKTEPAFAKVLNYPAGTDAYKVLLHLQKKSIRELREIIQTATLQN